jgi:hypothetical protein
MELDVLLRAGGLSDHSDEFRNLVTLRVVYHMLLLELSDLPNFLTGHEHFLVQTCEDNSHTLEGKTMRNGVDISLVRVLKRLRSVEISHLRGFIDSLDVDPYPLRVVRILTIIAVQVAHPLLHKTTLLPVSDEIAHLLVVHEGHKVDMSVSLPFQDHSWREALVTHAHWVRLVSRAVVVNFVGVGLNGSAGLAFLIRPVGSLAFPLHLEEVVLEGLVFDLDFVLVFRTVGAPLARRVGAFMSD